MPSFEISFQNLSIVVKKSPNHYALLSL